MPCGRQRHTLATKYYPPQENPQGIWFWSTQEIILGCFIDTSSHEIQIPNHWCDQLPTLVQYLVHFHRNYTKEWNILLEDPHNTLLVIPITWLCSYFIHNTLMSGAQHIKITTSVWYQIQDFLCLLEDIYYCPTHSTKFFPTSPYYFGAMDYSKYGKGVVWFPPYPPHLQKYSATRLSSNFLLRPQFTLFFSPR